jgi:hypothetical protein
MMFSTLPHETDNCDIKQRSGRIILSRDFLFKTRSLPNAPRSKMLPNLVAQFLLVLCITTPTENRKLRCQVINTVCISYLKKGP